MFCIRVSTSASRRIYFSSKNIPKFVQTVLCNSFDKPLEITDSQYNTPEQNKLKVELVSAGINFADILQCKGLYQEKIMPPFIPGFEFIGRIIEVGHSDGTLSNKSFQIGDWVLGMNTSGGAFANYVTTSESNILWHSRETVPNVDYQQGSALLVTYGTAFMALQRNANLVMNNSAKLKKTVLITAASGGVGLAAVELAKKVFNCNVIAAVGSQDKLKLALDKGADDGVVYSGMDGKAFREAVKDRSKRFGGVDIMIDMVGGDLLEAGIRCLNWEGKAVVVGFADGKIPKIPANLLLLKNLTMNGLYWGAHKQYNRQGFQESIDECIKLWLNGTIAPHISHKIRLVDVNKAFEMISNRETTGKVVLIP